MESNNKSSKGRSSTREEVRQSPRPLKKGARDARRTEGEEENEAPLQHRSGAGVVGAEKESGDHTQPPTQGRVEREEPAEVLVTEPGATVLEDGYITDGEALLHSSSPPGESLASGAGERQQERKSGPGGGRGKFDEALGRLVDAAVELCYTKRVRAEDAPPPLPQWRPEPRTKPGG